MDAPPPLRCPPPIPGPRPGVVTAYRWWCLLFVLVWAGMSAYSVGIVRGAIAPPLGLIEGAVVSGNLDAQARLIAEKRSDSVGVAVLAGLGAGFYLFAALVPRKPWGWVVGVVAISATVLPFIITAAGMVPLLVNWCRPPAKAYFGRYP